MLRCENALFFGRRADGSVRILKFRQWQRLEMPRVDGFYPEALFDAVISPDHWASIVASVSAEGEAGRFQTARQFHG